jgi:hypothetical protein
VDGTGPDCFPKAGFVIICIEPSISATGMSFSKLSLAK